MDTENYKNIKHIRVIEENREIYSYTRGDIYGKACFPVGCIFKAFLSILVGNAILEGKEAALKNFSQETLSGWITLLERTISINEN